MAIHWKVPFKSIGGTDYVVNIYDSTYTGTPVELTGADEPFFTAENNSNDILEPIRYSTGYINIVNNGEAAAIAPMSPKARFVTLTSGNTVMWQGYIKQQQFTQPWDSTPYVIQFPIISALGILDIKVEKGEVAERARIAEYLRLALTKTGATYDYIVFPADLALSSGAAYDVIFRLGLQDRNWFSYKNQNILDPDESRFDGMKWFDILSEIMKAFGYTMYEKGRTIYIIGRRRNYYLRITVSALATLASNGNPTETSVTSNTIQINNLQIGGNDGTIDITESKRRAVVEGQINPFQEDSFPPFNTLYLDYISTIQVTKYYNGEISTFYNKTLGLYGPEQDTNIWTFKSYQDNTEVAWSAQDITRDYFIGVYCKDYQGNGFILLNYDKTGNASAWGDGWLCSVKSPSQSLFAGGYLTLHAGIDFYEGDGRSDSDTHCGKFMLRIGSYYYNATSHSWTTTPSQFSTYIKGGNIAAMDTQEMGDNDSMFFKIPDGGIYGDVELFIYMPYSTSPLALNSQYVCEISKLDIQYIDFISDNYKDEIVTDTNRFVVSLNTFARDDEQKDTAITSFIQSRMGYGVIINPDLITPQGVLYDRYAGSIYMEDTLTRIITACYQKPQQILTIPVRQSNEFLPTDSYDWNGAHRYLSVERYWADDIHRLKVFKTLA